MCPNSQKIHVPISVLYECKLLIIIIISNKMLFNVNAFFMQHFIAHLSSVLSLSKMQSSAPRQMNACVCVMINNVMFKF